MIKLYDKTGETLLGNLDEFISCEVTEVRNGIFDAKIVYPAMRLISNDLIKENIIVCKANDTLLNQKFRIFNVRKKHSNTIEVLARHKSFDLLYDFIENINIVNQSCEYALNTIFRNSQFSRHYKGYSDIINAQDYSMSMTNCLNAIAGKQGSIIDTYGTGAEILRDNENIHVLNRRGHDNGVTIEYGKNLEGFECTEDTTDLITRIYPFVKKSTTEGDVTITLNEKFVDSPRINLYSHPYIKDVDLTSKFSEDEEVTQAKLKLEAEKYFIETKCDIPKLTFNIKFVPLSKCVGFEDLDERISLCDIVTIKHKIYGITTQVKVIKTVFDVATDRYKSMELGDPKVSLGDLIGSGDAPQVGPPGPQGPPGQDGSIGDFPDSLPAIPQLTANVLGFASVDLSWTYENKVYYNYQVFASKTENFEPNMFDLIFEGQASSFLHQVKPNETWYYRARAVNTHGKATELSTQVKVVTKKVDDFENYFSSVAIEKLVAGIFSVDYMTAGIIKGHWIDAKNLSVTDGNGKRTLDIDSYGNVDLDVNSLSIRSKKVLNEEELNKNFDINLLKNTLPHNNTEWQALNGSVSFVTSDTELKIHIINTTKQADAILIQENDKNILVDCGYNSTINIVIEYLKNNGVGEIDLFIATHAHTDHVGGIEAICNNFTIKEAIYREADWNIVDQIEPEGWGTSAAHRKMLEVFLAKGIKHREAKIIDVIKISNNGELRLINTTNETYDEYNTRSLGVLYTHYNNKILLASDMTIESEKHCLGEIGKVDVLKVGHHGANGSNSEAYLEEIKPQYGLITTMDIDHIDRKKALGCLQWEGIPMYDTGTNGTFVITSTKDDLSVSNLNTEYKLKNQWWYRRTVNNFEEWVYFKSDGSIARNETVTIGGGLYEFDENGICKEPY
ncbi:TPA: phage tail spike protein [Clostridium perfringens]|nr:tail protein endopeptidase [Clostridium phage phiCp-D]